MKKKLVLMLCVISFVLTTNSVQAIEISKPSLSKIKSAMPVNDTNKSVMKDQITNIISKSDKITDDYSIALENIVNTLLTREEIQAIKAEQKELKNDKKSKEKDITEGSMYTDMAAIIVSDEKSAEMTNRIKSLSADKTSELIKCIENVAVATTGYLDVAAESTTLLSQMANDPTTAVTMGADLKKLKKIATNAPTQAKSVGKISAGLFKLATGAGLKVTKAKTSSTRAKSTTNF